MLARAVIVGGLALLASGAGGQNRGGFSLWRERGRRSPSESGPDHPQVNFAFAMAEIGQAAAAGQDGRSRADACAASERASNAAPLAVEPFLIKGALAKTEGREDLAERLFVEARARDPRSAAARYFLAERYLSSGRAAEGLSEISVLARLVPGGSQLLVARSRPICPLRRDRRAICEACSPANPQIGASGSRRPGVRRRQRRP